MMRKRKTLRKGIRCQMNNDYRKLTRSTTNRSICGVCGGIGEYINIDPTIIRIIWIFCSLTSCGTGLIVYLIAALVIPEPES